MWKRREVRREVERERERSRKGEKRERRMERKGKRGYFLPFTSPILLLTKLVSVQEEKKPKNW